MADDAHPVDQHYGRAGLGETILDALRAQGADPDALTVTDLAPMDEFHLGGRPATVALAELAQLEPDMHVLDVGCGIGGPSRFLAAECGCRVTGLDLTREYLAVAEMLAARMGFDGRVVYEYGDALAMPFADGTFDAAWTQHASMNIADKAQLFREVLRVLKPGGRFALFDIVAGADGEVHFPVPWAPDASISFLVPADELRRAAEAAGFRAAAWIDCTEQAVPFAAQMAEFLRGAGPDTPPNTLTVLLGADAARMIGNVARSLAEGRLAVVRGLLERPA